MPLKFVDDYEGFSGRQQGRQPNGGASDSSALILFGCAPLGLLLVLGRR
jgi:hypothetical protein